MSLEILENNLKSHHEIEKYDLKMVMVRVDRHRKQVCILVFIGISMRIKLKYGILDTEKIKQLISIFF